MGKGSDRRPRSLHVTREEFDKRWDRIFAKKEKNTEKEATEENTDQKRSQKAALSQPETWID